MSGIRHKILKDSSKYLLATVFSQGAGLVRTLLLTIIFSPSQLGIWNFMNVVVGYGANAHLGLLHGMNKIIPPLKSANDTQRFHVVRDSVWWTTGFLGAIAGFIVFLSSYFVSINYSRELRIVSLIIFVQMFFTYLFCLLRAESRFAIVSVGLALFSALSTVFAIIFAYLHPNPLLGALWGLLLANVITVIYWITSASYRFSFSVSFKELREAFYLGVPLIFLGIVDMCFLSVDRWVIATKFSTQELGYYAIAIMVVNIMGLAATSLSNVLFPIMVEKFAQRKDLVGNENILLIPLNAVAAISPPVVFLIMTFLPIFIELLIPKYVPAIPLVLIMLPSAFFLSMAVIAGTYVISINRQLNLIVVQIIAAGISVLLDNLFISYGYGIRGVAYGTFIAYLFSGISYVGIAVYYATNSAREAIQTISRFILPIAVMVSGMVLVDAFISPRVAHIGLFKVALIKLLLIGLPLLLLLVLIHRRGRLWGILREELVGIRNGKSFSLVSQ